uniref:TPX2_importin domain-containing protein n=1 Tax=Syphacia muris TaxID=451379 RepID=A0A0N5ABS2_9BILA
MSDDNVYEIDSVPKFVAFSEMEPLANETIGDKFFDFVTQAENKENNHLNSFNTSESKPNSTELPLKASDAKVPQNQPDIGNISLFSFLKCLLVIYIIFLSVDLGVDDDDPLGMRKLAMFRPPRRSRDVAQLAQRLQAQSISKPGRAILFSTLHIIKFAIAVTCDTGVNSKNADTNGMRSNQLCAKRKTVMGVAPAAVRVRSASVDAIRVRSASVDAVRVNEKSKFVKGVSVHGAVKPEPIMVRKASGDAGSAAQAKRRSGLLPSNAKVNVAVARRRSQSVDALRRSACRADQLADRKPLTSSSKPVKPLLIRRSLSQQRNPAVSTASTSDVKKVNPVPCSIAQPKSDEAKSVRRSMLQTFSRSRPMTRAYAQKIEAMKLSRGDVNVRVSDVRLAESRKDQKRCGFGRVLNDCRIGNVETEEQFRNAVMKRPSGGASLERPVKSDQKPFDAKTIAKLTSSSLNCAPKAFEYTETCFWGK